MAWAGPEPEAPADDNTILIANDGTSQAGVPAGSAAAAKPSAHRADASVTPAKPAVAASRRTATSGAYSEHAPLAWFSLGSIAVGGIFYAINSGLDRKNVAYTAGDRSRLSSTVAVAGIGALLAAGSYFYYANHAASREQPDDGGLETEISGGLDAEGDPAVSAKLTLPLALLPSFR
jgi:hypothetical protein